MPDQALNPQDIPVFLQLLSGTKAFLELLWTDILKAPINIFTVINSFVFTIGAIFTIIQLRAARRSRQNAALSDVFARLSDHNNQTINDPYRRRAVEQFSKLNIPNDNIDPPITNPDELSRLYWGTRAFFIGLINILAQIWLLSGRPKRLGGDFAGWEKLATATVGELTGKTSASKPEWYRNACLDLWNPIKDGRVYPPGFHKWMMRACYDIDKKQ